MTFDDTSIWFLLFLICIPFLCWRLRAPSNKSGITFSSTVGVGLLPKTLRVRTSWIPSVLRIITITLLIICMARPQKRFERIQQSTDGVAIELVIDRSSSMNAYDFNIDDKPVDRLTAVRRVAGDFIQGMGDLVGRAGDMIGLITFAKYADSTCPMTFDHEFLVTDALQNIKIVADRQEDGTSIGDALALAVERLASLDSKVVKDSGNHIRSKVIILLTDGENNSGDIEPQTAADMAVAMDIKVYTIGTGTYGWAPVPMVDMFGSTVMRNQRVHIDEETLRVIASTTGGAYFRATDTSSLTNIYEAIDKMERSEITQRTYVNHVDVSVQGVSLAGYHIPPLLILALCTLLADTVLRSTYYRILD